MWEKGSGRGSGLVDEGVGGEGWGLAGWEEVKGGGRDTSGHGG